MSMYTGPYVFEFIGALVRWSFSVIFPKRKKQKKHFYNNSK
jgi:hypothetical protein